MRIVADGGRRSLHERGRLVRQYLSEHKDEQRQLKGISRCFGRLRLQLAAWRYANRELRKQGHGPHSLYSSR